MGEKPDDKKSERSEHPLRTTRKRLLGGMGSVAALSLAGCGYGFVSPKTSSTDPLMLQMGSQEKTVLQFFDQLPNNRALQSKFILDPAGTMVASGALPQSAAANISVGNRLYMYLLGNDSLGATLASIGSKYSQANARINALTQNNENIEALSSAVKQRIASDGDVQAMLGEQIQALIADSQFREILGLSLAPSEVPAFSQKLTANMVDYAAGEKPALVTPLVVANVLAIGNLATITLVAIAFSVVVSIAAGAFTTTVAIANTCYFTNGNITDLTCGVTEQAHGFLSELSARAHKLAAT